MPRPDAHWMDRLPTDRLIAEFSVWSAYLIRLADDLTRSRPHADIFQIDVADGVFAPGFRCFPDLVARIRETSDLPIHVHLMVADGVLLSQIDQFCEAGADLVSLHVENAAVAEAGLDRIAALNPAAPDRLREAKQLIQATGRRIVLAADGGIRQSTVPLLRSGGAETVVLGSLAFGAPDNGARMAWLHQQ